MYRQPDRSLNLVTSLAFHGLQNYTKKVRYDMKMFKSMFSTFKGRGTESIAQNT